VPYGEAPQTLGPTSRGVEAIDTAINWPHPYPPPCARAPTIAFCGSLTPSVSNTMPFFDYGNAYMVACPADMLASGFDCGECLRAALAGG
jgi:hypothetical protein